MILLKYLLVFLATFLADVAWTIYIRKTSQGKPLSASLVSGLIYVLGAYSFGEFVKDWTTVIPAVLGAMIGTYVTIRLDTGPLGERF